MRLGQAPPGRRGRPGPACFGVYAEVRSTHARPGHPVADPPPAPLPHARRRREAAGQAVPQAWFGEQCRSAGAVRHFAPTGALTSLSPVPVAHRPVCQDGLRQDRRMFIVSAPVHPPLLLTESCSSLADVPEAASAPPVVRRSPSTHLLPHAARHRLARTVAARRAVAARNNFTGVLEYDDGVYYGAAKFLLHGLMPYRDFTIVHPPAICVLLLPFAAIGNWLGDPRGRTTRQLRRRGRPRDTSRREHVPPTAATRGSGQR